MSTIFERLTKINKKLNDHALIVIGINGSREVCIGLFPKPFKYDLYNLPKVPKITISVKTSVDELWGVYLSLLSEGDTNES